MLSILTGTIIKIDKKLHRNETKYGSVFFGFPSISMVFGNSITNFRAASKHASAMHTKKRKCKFIVIATVYNIAYLALNKYFVELLDQKVNINPFLL